MFSRRNRTAHLLVFLLVVPLLASCGAEATSTPAGTASPFYSAAYPTNTTAASAPTATSAAAMAYAPAAQEDNQADNARPVPGAEQEVGGLNPMLSTEQDHLSTFALEVDTGSFTQARGYIESGRLPPAATVRLEEFVNYFNYHYPAPETDAFAIHVDAAPSPFNGGQTEIVRVGVQGKRIDTSQRADAVLTFVVDISGSMAEPNRLPLVKEALRLLVEELREGDQVGIVVYGSDARVALEHTSAANKARIMAAINSLTNDGSTNAEAGLRLGYQLAGKQFKNGASNRVILCSDGVANVGETSPEGIRKSIRDYAAQGIYLTTVGFGMGDYNDHLMEQLADDGNGTYAYVDHLAAAKRIFVQDLTGTLQVIAKDAKAQIDFNPDVVSSYRLLGYENRAIADSDFRNDKVDAGEIGAGHSATALYEVVRRKGAAGTVLTVQVRYADPGSGEVVELRRELDARAFGGDFATASPGFQLAVAAAGFANYLRFGDQQERWLSGSLPIVSAIAPQLANDAEVGELASLMSRAAQLRR